MAAAEKEPADNRNRIVISSIERSRFKPPRTNAKR
jgi:hypothetical protein